MIKFIVCWSILGSIISCPVPQNDHELTCRIKSLIIDSFADVSSFDITYSNHSYGSDAPEGAYLRRRVAGNRAGDWYHLNEHGSNELAADDDILRVESVVSGTQWRAFRSLNRYYNGGDLKKNELLPDSMPFDDFHLATGIWVATSRPTAKIFDHPTSLLEICRSEEYTVRHSDESDVNASSLLLENNDATDSIRLELREGIPYIVERTRRDPTTKLPVVTYRFKDIVVHSGLPVPTRIEVKFSKRNSQGKMVDINSEFIIDRVVVNNVPDSLFEIRPIPGELHYEFDTKRAPKQTMAGGWEHVHHLAQWCGRMGLKTSDRPIGYPLLACSILVVGILIGDFFRRRKAI